VLQPAHIRMVEDSMEIQKPSRYVERVARGAAADASCGSSNRYTPFTVSPFALTSASVGGAMRFVYRN
jgi:hypothetical protein